MLDPQLVRNHLDEVTEKLAKRGFKVEREVLADLEARRKQCQVETQRLQNERNHRSKAIGKAKASGEDITLIMNEVNQLNEQDNLEIRRWGTPRTFAFSVKDHVDLGTQLALLDFETATKITGTRFLLLRGLLARLQRALIQWMLDLHTEEHGYTEVR